MPMIPRRRPVQRRCTGTLRDFDGPRTRVGLGTLQAYPRRERDANPKLPPVTPLCFLGVVDDPKRLTERPRGPNPLPIETVRDLLGIVRVLYALHRKRWNHGLAKMLQMAGKQLRQALELAVRKGDTDAHAHAHAWSLASDALSTIGRVQNNSRGDDLAVAVGIASDRVRVRHFGAEDREAKRAARIKRG